MYQIKNPKFFSFANISIVTNVVITVLGICVFLPLGYVTRYFENSCVLYGSPKFEPREVNSTFITVDKSEGGTVWGKSTHCYYATYVPLLAAIHAFIWCWFLFSMKKQISRKGHDLPAYLMNAILNLVMSIALFVSSCILTVGFSSFCKNIESNLQSSCRDSQELVWSVFTIKEKPYSHKFYSFLLMSMICSWLLTGMVLFQCIFTIYMGAKTALDYNYKTETGRKGLYAYTNYLCGSYSDLMIDDTGSYKIPHTDNDENESNLYKL